VEDPNPRAEKTERAIIGTCPALRRAIEATKRVGKRDCAVIVVGETGTGKERIAQLVHQRSGRDGRFLAVNCASFTESMLEAELFGHEKGAFTGASNLKRGLFESADGGTLFLDEVGELPLALQAKLLRVLQEGAIRRVGGVREHRVDVRVVSATHQELQALADDGKFRLDLVYRLARYRITLPPLRDRGRDVVRIVRHMLKSDPDLVAEKPWRLCRDAEDVLLEYRWPGNVRELRNVLIQTTVDARGHRLTARHVRAALGLPRRERPERRDLDQEIVDLLGRRGEASAKEIRDSVGLSKSACQRRLSKLRGARRIEKLSGGSGNRYRLSASSPRDGWDERSEVALRMAGSEMGVTRQELADAACISERTASRVLQRLVAAGVLIAERRGRGVHYRTERVVPEAKPPA